MLKYAVLSSLGRRSGLIPNSFLRIFDGPIPWTQGEAFPPCRRADRGRSQTHRQAAVDAAGHAWIPRTAVEGLWRSPERKAEAALSLWGVGAAVPSLCG